MAAYMMFRVRLRRAIRRNRIFRDRTHPMEMFNDEQLHARFRFERHIIYELVDELNEQLEYGMQKKGCLTPILQVCIGLRFYATGSYQTVIGDLFNIDQATGNLCQTFLLS